MTTVVPEQGVVAAASVTHPTPCTGWCKDRDYPAGHNHSAHDTAHRSPSLTLASPNPRTGEDVLVRAELFRLDERSDIGETVIYVEGETSFQMSLHETAIFLAQGQAFLDGVRVLLAQMGDGQ